MQYTEGYLAFLDILGFSKYVEDENNGEATADLFEFVKKFSYLFNSSPNLSVHVSFFSDTIIITSSELSKLTMPIYIAESYLKQSLGLLFRGGIVFGKYYHKDGATFGPAVVAGYRLENKAIYSRILVDNSVTIEDETENIFYFVDVDGYRCFNPYGMFFMEVLKSAPNGIIYPDDINTELIELFSNRRDELLLQINKYKGSTVVDKYLWRIRAYNQVCYFVSNIPLGETIYGECNYNMNEDLKEKICKLIINEADIR